MPPDGRAGRPDRPATPEPVARWDRPPKEGADLATTVTPVASWARGRVRSLLFWGLGHGDTTGGQILPERVLGPLWLSRQGSDPPRDGFQAGHRIHTPDQSRRAGEQPEPLTGCSQRPPVPSGLAETCSPLRRRWHRVLAPKKNRGGSCAVPRDRVNCTGLRRRRIRPLDSQVASRGVPGWTGHPGIRMPGVRLSGAGPSLVGP